jgi:gamma-polyglutamate biosynthesis protein CapA
MTYCKSKRKVFFAFGAILTAVCFLILIFSFHLFQSGQLYTSVGLIQDKASDNMQPAQRPIRLAFVGDVMLGRSVQNRILDTGNINFPFEKVSDYLAGFDLVFANLENPFVENCPRHEGGFTFCAKNDIVGGLKNANISVVSIANNHMRNYGLQGYENTIKVLQQSGIKYADEVTDARVLIDGMKIDIIAFDLVTNQNPLEDIKTAIFEARGQTDYLIVSFHWGNEYEAVANNYQRTVARASVESGADLIVGHHPHVLQDYEFIEGKPVIYSLGNFVFDQMWSEETKEGAILEIEIVNKELADIKFTPTKYFTIGQPEIVDVHETFSNLKILNPAI